MHRDANGGIVYSCKEKGVCDVLGDYYLKTPSKLLKTVACVASWAEVLGEEKWAGQIKTICADRTQIIQLPKALRETKEVVSKGAFFCLDPSFKSFSAFGFSAIKAGSKWATFLAGLFSILQNSMAALCKTIRFGLSSILDLTNIYKSVVELNTLENDRVEVSVKQVELGKNTAAFAFHSASFATRVLSGVAISPILLLALNTFHLVMSVIYKVFDADVKNKRQYEFCVESLALNRSSL